ncbi:MAG TPA: CoA-binding protein [Alphaproteobacteria bacterium]|jgi:predicted CoA-binding protein|nr:CoA-binding protein [Alphaproteobacteria bacterium]
MAELITTDAKLRDLLKATRTIALVGASPKPNRPSHGVMAFLQRAGYRVIPVNPTAAGTTILGETVVANLADIKEAIDMVDVFRRAEDTPEVAREAVAVGAKSLWLQLDIANDESARIATEGGLDVVMDRCTAIEVGRLL